MAHTPASQQSGSSSAVMRPAAAFVSSLARLIKNSTYYPEGHRMYEQAVTNFLTVLKVAAAKSESVVFEVDRKHCLVGEEKISGLAGINEEMRQLFFDVGFRCIIFHDDVTAKDMQTFIRKVFAWKIEAESAKGFRFFSGKDLPQTIEVYQQQFTRPKIRAGGGFEGGEDFYDGISKICRALVDAGYSKVDALICRDFMVQMVEDSRKDGSMAGIDGAEIDGEMLIQLMTNVLEQISQSRKADTQLHATDLNTISSIFERFAGEEVQGAGRHAIDTLLGYFENELPSTPKELDDGQRKNDQPQKKSPQPAQPEKRRYADVGRGTSPEERKKALEDFVAIDNFVKEKSLSLSLLQQLPNSDRSEDFSILLQLFLGTTERSLLENLARRLQEILRKRPNAKELRVLQAGLASVAVQQGFAGFYVLAKIVVNHLRVGKRSNGLRFVLALSESLGRQHSKTLWPFLVNEAFIAGTEEKELFASAVARAVLPFKEMVSLRPYLERLDAFSGKEKMAEDIFLPEKEEVYPLYACLLEGCCGRLIGTSLLDTAVISMTGEVAFLGEVLDMSNDDHFQIVKEYFYSHGRALPAGTVRKVGEIAAAYLSGYKNKNENDENLSRIILAAGRFAKGGFASFLNSVISEKKMGVLPLWPPLCRKNAAVVLAAPNKRTL